MTDRRLENLRILTGIVNRLTKEKASYQNEANVQRCKIERCKQEENDEGIIRRLEEGLQMTTGIIIDCQNRLLDAYRKCKASLDAGNDLTETEEYTAATRVMDVAKDHLPAIQNETGDAHSN